MSVVNTRALSALAVVAVLLVGTALAFGPFVFAASRMRHFCAGLAPGSSKEQVQRLAHATGYDVSYDAEQAPGDAGDAGAGAIDGGAGMETAESISPPPVRVIAGDALVTDPQFFRPTCALFFDGAGLLKASVFDDD